MHDPLRMQINQSPNNLFHVYSGDSFRDLFTLDFFIEFSSWHNFQYQGVFLLVVINFVDLDNVGVIERPHDSKLFQEFFVVALFKLFFLNYFSRPNHLGVNWFDHTHNPETSPSDFFNNLVIGQIISRLHFSERVPFYLNLLNIHHGKAWLTLGNRACKYSCALLLLIGINYFVIRHLFDLIIVGQDVFEINFEFRCWYFGNSWLLRRDVLLLDL